ncbi:DUF6255 family natural product biosynthesis protein [Streptomyces luteireticuli]|uniref:DUF6255 family natural product biosynthesis protein n=1 Tax=Streptomyces luteireticuli TaxID=173858 RepID=UPI0035570665
MHRAVGRLVHHCPHPSGWEAAGEGEEVCAECGTRRFHGYGALRPPGLPEAVAPHPPPHPPSPPHTPPRGAAARPPAMLQ